MSDLTITPVEIRLVVRPLPALKIVVGGAGGGGGGGTGNVVGPASSVAGHLAVFADTSGELIADGGALTAAGLALLDDADAAAQRVTLGVPAGSGTSTGANTGDQTITLMGDATGSGTGTIAVTVPRLLTSLGKIYAIARGYPMI